MKDYLLFTTTSGNRYCFHRRRGTVLLCHPLLYHVIGLHRAGLSVDAWFASIQGDVVHIDDARYARSDAELARRKFHLLLQDGFFGETSEHEAARALSARLSASDVEAALASTPQVVFELTERCNLRCDYCCFGHHYVQSGLRDNRDLDFTVAKTLLDYLAHLSTAKSRSGAIGPPEVAFYGGEPLLPFSLLQQIVHHARNVLGKRSRFRIVTNGLLLPERWDFLVQNDFETIVSLDGDETCNTYRRFPDGTPAYERVLQNVRALREKHRDYFERRVSFNAVLTDRGSVSSVRDFFAQEFGKNPEVSSLASQNVKFADNARWMAMVEGFSADGACAGAPSEANRETLLELSMPIEASNFLSRHAPCHFGDYREALQSQSGIDTPTMVCRPFTTRLFLTARGEILPCERINRCHALGRVSATAVEIDFGGVAAMYNQHFERLTPTCSSCQHAFDCLMCMFKLDLKQPRIQCHLAASEDEYRRRIAAVIDYMERNRTILPGGF